MLTGLSAEGQASILLRTINVPIRPTGWEVVRARLSDRNYMACPIVKPVLSWVKKLWSVCIPCLNVQTPMSGSGYTVICGYQRSHMTGKLVLLLLFFGLSAFGKYEYLRCSSVPGGNSGKYAEHEPCQDAPHFTPPNLGIMSTVGVHPLGQVHHMMRRSV